MSEFNDRMSLQRQIVQIVNSKVWGNESLFGLSGKAIDRWLATNKIDLHAPISELLYAVSSKLFFLAAKSQEQISDDYRVLETEVHAMIQAIEAQVASAACEVR